MERERATKFIHELLDLLVKQKGSDLFITSGFPPAIKVDGKISPVSKSQLSPQHTIELVRSVMNDKQAAEFEGTKECNFAISPPGIGRFRVNAYVQQGKRAYDPVQWSPPCHRNEPPLRPRAPASSAPTSRAAARKTARRPGRC